jgi:hypothetical protein
MLATSQPTVAVPHLIKFVHPDIDPGSYWLSVDEWMASFGGADNATWEEVAPLYAARMPTSRAARLVMQGRIATP